MVGLLRGASLALILAQASGARISKKRRGNGQSAKFIAGVPVVNYQIAYGGQPNFAGLEETREEEWIMMMNEGTTDAQIESMCQVARNGCKMVGHPDAGGVAFLDMRGTEKDVEAVINSARGVVQLIEIDQVLEMIPELEAEPVTQTGGSWGLNRVGSRGRSGNQGAGTHIFILDTGVRTTHEDFGGRAVPMVDFSPLTGRVYCNGDLSCAADNQGHGTHCAGTAAGTTYGVATKANVYGVKVLGDSGMGNLFAIIGSVDYLASTEERPAVGSMSLGGTCPLGFCGMYFAMRMAVDKAVESGVTVVVAGGNSNKDACGFMPAYVPSAITVGSTTSNDERSSFSNYGKCTNLWAPGSKITSATHEDDTGAKTFSGTSMACPHVAGGAAMVLERHPEFKGPQVLEKLHSYAATNYITDLQDGDVNKLLYLAADAPPPKGPVEEAAPTAESSLSEVESAATIPVRVRDCSGSRHVAKLTDYSPKTVQTGRTTTIRATGRITEDVTGGRMNMEIKMTGFPWTTLASVSNHNICTPKTLELRAVGVWGGRMEFRGLPCPVRASQGLIELPITLTLASVLPGGLANVAADINGTSANGKPLLCASVTTSR